MRVAVTGAGGRLGRSLIGALEDSPFAGAAGPISWSRPAFDLDAPDAFPGLLDRDRPELVVHAAAWTDVDGCARDPELALARNGVATGRLAEACAARGVDLLVLSTNEVFDGRRTDSKGYRPTDAPNPINPYGVSKLAGERFAEDAFRDASGSLGIVRTAWLFGPPGNDFPDKILTAAERARSAGIPLRVVADETGSPTYTHDLAEAIAELIGSAATRGTFHIVNTGRASRSDWAREVLRQAGIEVETEDVPAATWPRDSTPPRWAVLEPTPLSAGEPLRSWQAALADDLAALLRNRARAAVRR
jgi:dTDP-4-dehydrorhamnose reductase